MDTQNDRQIAYSRNNTDTYRWVEIWSYVSDNGISRWIEEWEMSEQQQQQQRQQETRTENSLAAQRFASVVRLPTGRNFLAMVADYFSLQA